MTAATKIRISPQQKAIFNWVQDGSGNGIIRACAGSGKTSTMRMAIEYMEGQVGFAVFNKKAQDDANALIRADNATVKTFHAHGFEALRRAFSPLEVEPKKHSLVTEEVGVPAKFWTFTRKLVSLAKGQVVGVLHDEDSGIWEELVDFYGIDQELNDYSEARKNKDSNAAKNALDKAVQEAIDWSKEAFEAHLRFVREHHVIDFDDMLFAALACEEAEIRTYDWVLIDECQDLNGGMRLLAKSMCHKDTRLLAVGDDFQSINGWAGASIGSMSLVQEEFKCKQFPLSVSFRCPKAVVAEASKDVPPGHIEPHKDAPEGIVREMTFDQFIALNDFSSKDVVVCRINKPTVRLALKFIAQGIPCYIVGRDFGKGLSRLATRWKRINTIEELEAQLEEHKLQQTARFLRKKNEAAIVALHDQIDCLLTIMSSLRTGSLIGELQRKIDSMFADEDKKLALSSIHRAKGREWDRVFMLGNNLWLPHPMAKKDWQKDQERFLSYVSKTRAKKELVTVNLSSSDLGGKK